MDEQQVTSTHTELLNALEIQQWESSRVDPSDLDLREEIVRLNRVAKVVKGGRRFSFSAVVAVGNGRGIVGVGKGKAKQVPDAISKAVENAKRNLVRITRVGRTIPHGIVGEFGSARVLLRPASEGTGVIAGAAVRAVIDLAGIQDVLTKNLGSSNVINVVKATVEALKGLGNAEHVARLRGKRVEDIIRPKQRAALHQCMRESMPRITSTETSEASVALEAHAAGAEQIKNAESEAPSPQGGEA